MQIHPAEIPMCAAFKEYEGVPETTPLDFTEDDITWVTSKFSVTAGTLGVETIDIQNWLVCFGCVSKDLRVFVAWLAVWMDNSSPFWTS